MTLLAATLMGAMLGLANFGARGTSVLSWPVLAPEAVALVAGVLFVRHTSHATAPFIPARLLYHGVFAAMNVFNLLFGMVALGFSALVPLYAQERYGMSTLASGTLLTARAVATIICAALSVLALRRFGYRRPIILGTVVAAVGVALLAISAPLHLSTYLWLAFGAGCDGRCIGVLTPGTNNAVLYLVPEHTAAVSGLRGMFRQCGGIIGVSVTTAVLARSSNPGLVQAHAFLIFAGILLLSVPLVLTFPGLPGHVVTDT